MPPRGKFSEGMGPYYVQYNISDIMREIFDNFHADQ